MLGGVLVGALVFIVVLKVNVANQLYFGRRMWSQGAKALFIIVRLIILQGVMRSEPVIRLTVA